MFYGGPFCWVSKKQRCVARSSCESEYIAQSTYAAQGQWAAQILRDLSVPEFIGVNSHEVNMRGDNQGAIALTKNPHIHDRSKHIDICYHHIRGLVQKGKLSIKYTPTAEMPADGFTKPLKRVAFEKFKNLLGIEAN